MSMMPNPKMVTPKTQFGVAPPGYVAGLGRGAVGFTTRSDIGPARPVTASETPAKKAPPKETDYSDANFDEFTGYNEGLFASGSYDKEDDEADAIYMAIDRRMDSKRKKRREDKLKAELAKYRKKRPRIQEQFIDVKTALGTMDQEAWESIPEPLDYSRRNQQMKKKSKVDKYTPVPDSLLDAANPNNKHGHTLDRRQQRYGGMQTPLGMRTPTGGLRTPVSGFATPGYATPSGMSTPHGLATPRGGMATPFGGMMTPMGGGMMTPMGGGFMTPMGGGFNTPMSGAMTPGGGPSDLTQLGRARAQILAVKLGRMADSVSGQTVVDPKGYLTDLKTVKVNTDTEVSDIKKARLLLKSVITTNPKHAPGWIAAARLEKETGKLAAARAIIMKGCEVCRQNADVWLEAARMQTPRNAKSILAKAVRHIPKSVKIWVAACQLENTVDGKKAVLRRALELIPNSVQLWKAAVELENPEDARVMLSRAVELVPMSVDMWLALARLETYEKARIVLNRARQVIPTEPAIWITAAKLEEANQNVDNVDRIIQKAVQSLAAHQVMIDRDSWLAEAEQAEAGGALLTCQAIVNATVGIGIDEEDRKNTWLNDAEQYLMKESIETARAIYNHALSIFPGKKKIWMQAAQLEKQHGDRDSLDILLKKAVQYCPQAETLWLMGAKEKWLAGDIQGARVILNDAFMANPDSEQVWLAAIKLESESNEDARAKMLLQKARERAGTARVWMKSAKLERATGNRARERELLDQALDQFPQEHKLWIMMAQHLEYMAEKGGSKDVSEVRKAYKRAMKQCPESVDLWLCYADLEARTNPTVAKSRSILETARLRCPANARLWLASIRVEEQAMNREVAKGLMAKALQECRTEGVLWQHAIETDARPLRKSRSYDALKRCSDDPYVFCAVAKLFWVDRKVRKARNWFNRAVTVDPDLGDTWAWFYKFEMEHGSTDKQRSVVKRCIEADPRHGEMWCKVAKNVKNSKETLKTDDILEEVVANIKHIFPQCGRST